MKAQNRVLCEEYVNKITDLQYKRRKKQEEFIILALLLAVFIEYLSNENAILTYQITALTDYKEFKNPTKMVKLLDEALDNKGKLAVEVKIFKTKNTKLLTFYTNIIPQKAPKINENDYFEEMREQTDLYEQNAQISLYTNQMLFNKSFKTWNTQRDSKVRKTVFHNGIDGIEVGINEMFTVNQYSAMYPAHHILPDFDRFNCRCYLTYR